MENEIEVGEIFTLVDENDEEQEVEVLAKFNVERASYIAVSFIEEIELAEDDEFDVFFLRIDERGELEAIETDEEFEKVAMAFEKTLEDDREASAPYQD